MPKTRDRGGEGRCFRSQLLPPYLKKTRRLEAVIPWLYLKGVSTNAFDEALQALFGESVKGLSPATIARLKRGWEAEYAEWRSRDWHGQEFVYLWADGIYTNVRAGERRCILVLVGCGVHGRKHFLAIEDGFRESTESWKALLLSLRDRGVKPARLTVGDGALGFWAAISDVYPQTGEQRCRVHKTVNVLDKLPKRLQARPSQRCTTSGKPTGAPPQTRPSILLVQPAQRDEDGAAHHESSAVAGTWPRYSSWSTGSGLARRRGEEPTAVGVGGML